MAKTNKAREIDASSVETSEVAQSMTLGCAF
jgi:hypothetical protein